MTYMPLLVILVYFNCSIADLLLISILFFSILCFLLPEKVFFLIVNF